MFLPYENILSQYLLGHMLHFFITIICRSRICTFNGHGMYILNASKHPVVSHSSRYWQPQKCFLLIPLCIHYFHPLFYSFLRLYIRERCTKPPIQSSPPAIHVVEYLISSFPSLNDHLWHQTQLLFFFFFSVWRGNKNSDNTIIEPGVYIYWGYSPVTHNNIKVFVWIFNIVWKYTEYKNYNEILSG